jgi:hypothetical protein
MLRILWLFPLVFFSLPAMAIYKCESHGKITYSDEPCRSGKILELNDSAGSQVTASDLSGARQQIAREKAELKRLENQRYQREAAEEKRLKKISQANALKQKKCNALALRTKWTNDDAATASGKSADKARRNAQRAAEKYVMECGK